MTRRTLRTALAAAVLALGSLLAPPAAQAQAVGCVLFPHKTVRSEWNGNVGVLGHGEQLCYRGYYTTQALRICLEQKEVKRFLPDVWHRVKCQRKFKWTTGETIERRTHKLCDTTAKTEWRTRTIGKFINQVGEEQDGEDFSDGRWHACHEWYHDAD